MAKIPVGVFSTIFQGPSHNFSREPGHEYDAPPLAFGFDMLLIVNGAGLIGSVAGGLPRSCQRGFFRVRLPPSVLPSIAFPHLATAGPRPSRVVLLVSVTGRC